MDKTKILLMGIFEGKSNNRPYYYINVCLSKEFNQDIARIFINKATFDLVTKNLDKYLYSDISNYITYNYDFYRHNLSFVFDLEGDDSDLPL